MTCLNLKASVYSHYYLNHVGSRVDKGHGHSELHRQFFNVNPRMEY